MRCLYQWLLASNLTSRYLAHSSIDCHQTLYIDLYIIYLVYGHIKSFKIGLDKMAVPDLSLCKYSFCAIQRRNMLSILNIDKPLVALYLVDPSHLILRMSAQLSQSVPPMLGLSYNLFSASKCRVETLALTNRIFHHYIFTIWK